MFLIGALISTFIVSRLLLLVIAKLSGKKFYVSCNAVSLLLSALLFSFGAGENFPDFSTAFVSALTLYALPQFVWLAVDFIRFQRACRPVKDEKEEKNLRKQKRHRPCAENGAEENKPLLFYMNIQPEQSLRTEQDEDYKLEL